LKSKVLTAQSLSVAALLVLTGVASAQTATGSISGRVVDMQGLVVPGVTVTVQSPNLQGSRVALTSANGDYLFPLLPPGVYTLTFEFSGFANRTETRDVGATQSVTVDMTMTPAGVREELTVFAARSDTFVSTVQSATNITATTLAVLPTNRTLLAAVDLSAGVHSTGFQQAPMISGGMSTENVFMLNGAQITENIRNAPLSLFIEDAIQEVTTTTSGISAEYGRFTGGIVNAITKSGGNRFNGSFRTTLTNDNWRSASPFGEPKTAQVVPTYEFTAGGPIVRDRTWYFGAGRVFDRTVTSTVGAPALPYESGDNEKRFETKLTQLLGAGQTVTVAYTNVERHLTNAAFPNPGQLLDLRSLTDHVESQNLLSARYTGTFGSRLFLEGQLLSRNLTANQGSGSTDRIMGSMVRDRSRGFRRYWASPFCTVCGDAQFDSTEVLAKGNYFISTARGTHNLVFGYDTFNDNVVLNNHLTGSDYIVDSTTSVTRDGVVYPVFNNNNTTFILYQPIVVPSIGWNFRTHALFLTDTLRYNDRLTLNLGVRWDKNDGTDSIGNRISTGGTFSPRLGIVWDVKGDGQWTAVASFSRYVGAVDGPVANAASPAGRPAFFMWSYGGPAVNTNPAGTLVPPDQALQILFDWFDGVGGTGLRPYASSPVIPGFTTAIEDSLDSPAVIEYAAGLSRRLGARGVVRGDVIYRAHRDFYTLVTNMSTGRVTNSLGQTFDLTRVENTNAEKRRYAGLMMQSNYRLSDRLDIGGNYTLSRLWATFGADGPVANGFLSFPEYFDVRWSAPERDHPGDQRHRLRAWSTYRLLSSERVGSFTVSGIERIESGTPYYALGSIDSRPFVANPGYVNPPAFVTYFFTGSDEFRTDTMVRTDLALNYDYKIAGRSGPELFIQVQLLNVFNQFAIVDPYAGFVDLSLGTPATAPARYQAFNPFTTMPVRGVNWEYSPTFGSALGAGAYNLPRTFLVTFGIRY
jgi:hypothetical protein